MPPGPLPARGYPVIIFIHGGAFLSEWNKDSSDRLTEALSQLGYAVWSLEYRRLGDTGGGFPNTFADVLRGADAVRKVAVKYQLDLNRMIAVGHSAGGQLALLLAERRNLPATSPLYSPDPIRLRGVIALSGTSNYESAVNRRVGVLEKMGVREGAEANAFYAQISPINLLPLGVPTWMIDETEDLHGETGYAAWRNASTQDFIHQAIAKGDKIHGVVLHGANHYDLIDADGPAFKTLKSAVFSLLHNKD